MVTSPRSKDRDDVLDGGGSDVDCDVTANMDVAEECRLSIALIHDQQTVNDTVSAGYFWFRRSGR
jgi:hypothetical protein